MRRRFSILIWFTSEGVMLKRIIWILFLLGLTGGCELFAHDGTVNISGSFRRNTCVLAQDSKQINVQLGDVSLTRFFHGNYGPEKSFIINLQDCGTDVSTVDVTFSGTPTECRAKYCPLKVVRMQPAGWQLRFWMMRRY